MWCFGGSKPLPSARVERSRRTAGELEYGEVRYGSSALSSKLLSSPVKPTVETSGRRRMSACTRMLTFRNDRGCT